MKIGEVIRGIRLENGATLEDIAFAADTDAGNLSRIERGRQRYTPEILERIAAALGVSVSQLYQRAEQGQPVAERSPIAAAMPKPANLETTQTALLGRIDRLNEVNQHLVDEFVKLLLRSQKLKP